MNDAAFVSRGHIRWPPSLIGVKGAVRLPTALFGGIVSARTGSCRTAPTQSEA